MAAPALRIAGLCGRIDVPVEREEKSGKRRGRLRVFEADRNCQVEMVRKVVDRYAPVVGQRQTLLRKREIKFGSRGRGETPALIADMPCGA